MYCHVSLEHGWLIFWFVSFFFSDQDRVCEYNMKLMDIDSEHLGIPVGKAGSGIVHLALQGRLFC